jgi:hypothetical protein
VKPRLPIFRAGLLGILLSHAAFADETCVAKSGGGWKCGQDVTASDGAQLPRAQRTSRPPLLLIDPRRFGEGNEEPAVEAPKPPVAEPIAAPPVAVVEPIRVTQPDKPTEPVKVSKPVGEVVTIPAVNDAQNTRVATLADVQSGGAFTVQLALASSTKGFDKLRTELKLSRANTRELPLKNGSWALLLGVFPSIEAARKAIPTGAKGAFAREIRALEQL